MTQEIRCVADVSRVQARLRPQATAIWFEGQITTYAQLDQLASQ